MSEQPRQDLVNYIWTYLHQGYSLTSIRGGLQNQGFSLQQINFAIDYIYANYYYGKNQDSYRDQSISKNLSTNASNNLKRGHHSGVIMALIIIGVILLGFSMIFILSQKTSVFKESTFLENQNPASEEGNSKPNSLNNNEKLNNQVDNNEQEKPNINSNNNIDNTANSGNNINSNTNTNPTSEVDNSYNQQTVVPNRNYNSVESSYDPRKSYTISQINLNVDYYSSRNPAEAINFCNALKENVQKYFCYRDVMIGSGNSGYCELIDELKYKDDCLFSAVLENVDGGSVCSKIDNDYKQENCYRIVEINAKLLEYNQKSIDDFNTSENNDLEKYSAVVANFY